MKKEGMGCSLRVGVRWRRAADTLLIDCERRLRRKGESV